MKTFFQNNYKMFDISDETIHRSILIEESLKNLFQKMDDIKEYNQLKVIKAMQKAKLSDIHFNSTTGYGYNDIGREKLEEIFAFVFGSQDALVRPNIVNGTHALAISLQGILQKDDYMLSITGKPYDTLDKVIGVIPHEQSLINRGIHYHQIELLQDGNFDENGINDFFLHTPNIRLIYIQRSKGYSRRKSITVSDIKKISQFIKSINPETIIMVDNCYGEFIEKSEPTEVGVDLMAGSLIKNPGGGLALTGGYVAGKSDLVEQVAERLTTPGIGREVGLTFGTTRQNTQGLFFAPSVVNSALKGAIFCAKIFNDSGYDVFPLYDEIRSDIIQAIAFETKEEIIEFCKSIQQAAPVDSFVIPEPWDMPGYDSPVIMAAGSFIQGSSIELSADAPIREPYTVYFQGGLTYEHSKLGALMAFDKIKKLKEKCNDK